MIPLRLVVVAVMLAALVGPARASGGVHVGIALGGPVYAYPPPFAYAYPYPYPAYAYPYPYYAVPPAVWPTVPPPRFEAGHWEQRVDPWGRPVSAWVPGHLR